MAWTKEPPTEPGFYWWRIEDTAIKGIGRVLLIEDVPHGQLYGLKVNTDLQEEAVRVATEWWDEPIEPPDN